MSQAWTNQVNGTFESYSAPLQNKVTNGHDKKEKEDSMNVLWLNHKHHYATKQSVWLKVLQYKL